MAISNLVCFKSRIGIGFGYSISFRHRSQPMSDLVHSAKREQQPHKTHFYTNSHTNARERTLTHVRIRFACLFLFLVFFLFFDGRNAWDVRLRAFGDVCHHGHPNGNSFEENLRVEQFAVVTHVSVIALNPHLCYTCAHGQPCMNAHRKA